MSEISLKNNALRSIQLQSQAVAALAAYVDAGFLQAVQTIAQSNGRLVLSGIGKSAIIAQKIAATLNSTGTPALFMHAADAIHGDLGMIQTQDVVMVISKSGDSPEIKVLAPLVKNFGNTLIGMVGNIKGYLALHADIVINSTVAQEACPHNLAPTTSTTAQMVMGDALAICLMEAKAFQSADFAKYHPGGALGKKMYLRVGDMIQPHERPQVQLDTSIKQTIIEITNKRLGAVVVVDEQEKICGIITDGDIRRMLENFSSFDSLCAKDIMGSQPKTIAAEELAVAALEKMRVHHINHLVVIDAQGYRGILHIQELMREGII